jgi:mannose-1-phosphate guanylyltransferase/mannose-6-phosphate isomerase
MAFQPDMYKYYALQYAEMLKRFKDIPANSIDYGVMQKTSHAALVKFEPRWTDLGSWDSFLQYYDEGKGNLKIGSGEFIESQGCFTYSKNRLVCMVGLKDVVAIDSSDALLLVKRGDSDKVKDLVAHINSKGLLHSKDGATVYRPWGYYTILHEAKGYKVKEIGIYPKKSLSLQKHQYRSEHWNVVEGSMNVFIGGREINLLRNESVFVPKNIRHKIYNPTNKISKIIEVQIGGYLGEDDIVRFDKY